MSGLNQIAGICNCAGNPTIIGKATGCVVSGSNTPLQGVLVTAYEGSTGGAVLASTMTDSSGDWTLSSFSPAPTIGVNIVVVLSYTGFANLNITITYTSGTVTGDEWSPDRRQTPAP